MNRTFKVCGRYRAREEQQPWSRGKPGLLAKKSVYTSLIDLDKYGPELIKRWSEMYFVEVFELIDGKWVPYEFQGMEV